MRIRHEMQRAGEEAALGLVIADIDDADIDQLAREDRLDPPARGGIEDVERVVDHHPSRPLQDDAGKGQALLLVVVQLPVPSVHLVEKGLEAFQANIGKRLGDDRILVDVGRVRIGDRRRAECRAGHRHASA